MRRIKVLLERTLRPFKRLAEKRRKWRVPREMVYALTGDPEVLNTDRKLNDFRMEQQAIREQMDRERRIKEALEEGSVDPYPYASSGPMVYGSHLAKASSSMESALQLGSYMLQGKDGSWLGLDLHLLRLREDALRCQLERLGRQLDKMEKELPTASQEGPSGCPTCRDQRST